MQKKKKNMIIKKRKCKNECLQYLWLVHLLIFILNRIYNLITWLNIPHQINKYIYSYVGHTVVQTESFIPAGLYVSLSPQGQCSSGVWISTISYRMKAEINVQHGSSSSRPAVNKSNVSTAASRYTASTERARSSALHLVNTFSSYFFINLHIHISVGQPVTKSVFDSKLQCLD